MEAMIGETAVEETVSALVGGHPKAVPAVDEEVLDEVETTSQQVQASVGIEGVEAVGVGQKQLVAVRGAHKETVVGRQALVVNRVRPKALRSPGVRQARIYRKGTILGEGPETALPAAEAVDVRLRRQQVLVAGRVYAVEALRRRNVETGTVDVKLAVGQHEVEERGFGEGFARPLVACYRRDARRVKSEGRRGVGRLQSGGCETAEGALLFAGVLGEQEARRQVCGIEVVQHALTGGVSGMEGERRMQGIEAPVAPEAEGVDLAVQLLEIDDVDAAALKEGRQRATVVAHEAGEGANVDVAAGVLPDGLGLHLGQAVLSGEATETEGGGKKRRRVKSEG